MLRSKQINIKPKLIVMLTLGIALLLAVATSLYLHYSDTTAADKKNWVANEIISDYNFTDKNSMSVNEIQTFLDKQIGSCDMWGTGQAVEFGSSLTRAQYAASRGWSGPPYVCLNKYYEVPKTSPNKKAPVTNFNKDASIPSGAKSAAWIIKDAANRYSISPKVLLVKIATESAGPLTSDKWPLFSQYRYAMGSYCPDSGPGGSANCNSSYAGFSIQMYSAAELMRSYLTNMDQPWWTLKRPGKGADITINSNTKDLCSSRYGKQNSNCIGWNVPRSCGGTVLNIKNKATAALYTYTPYQPNKAALNKLYGTGDGCSAYGNRNFWRVYTDWFGATRFTLKGSIKSYYESNDGYAMLGDAIEEQKTDGKGFWWQRFERGYIAGQYSTGYYPVKGSISKRYGSDNGIAHLGKPLELESKDENGNWWQRFERGYIAGQYSTGYYAIKGSIGSYFTEANGQARLGAPQEEETQQSDGSWSQKFTKGYIVGRYSTGYWESKGSIRSYWQSNGSQDGRLGLPIGPEEKIDDGWYQKYQGGAIIGKYATGYHAVKGSIGEKYLSDLNGSQSLYGLPLGNEMKTAGGAWSQEFVKAHILGKNGRYYISTGPIREKWLELGGWDGTLGPIKTDITYYEDGGSAQEYTKGWIYLAPEADKAWTSKGSIRKAWISLGAEKSRLGYPTSSEKNSAGVWSQDYQNGTLATKNGKLHQVSYTD